MARIVFKAKMQSTYHAHDPSCLAYQWFQVPALNRSHCDMEAFRKHPKYRDLANSDLFPNVLARIRRDVIGAHGDHLRLDRLPANVTVEAGRFLHIVTIDV